MANLGLWGMRSGHGLGGHALRTWAWRHKSASHPANLATKALMLAFTQHTHSTALTVTVPQCTTRCTTVDG